MPTIVEPVCEVCLEPLQDEPSLNNLMEGLCKKCFLRRMDDWINNIIPHDDGEMNDKLPQ